MCAKWLPPGELETWGQRVPRTHLPTIYVYYWSMVPDQSGYLPSPSTPKPKCQVSFNGAVFYPTWPIALQTVWWIYIGYLYGDFNKLIWHIRIWQSWTESEYLLVTSSAILINIILQAVIRYLCKVYNGCEIPRASVSTPLGHFRHWYRSHPFAAGSMIFT